VEGVRVRTNGDFTAIKFYIRKNNARAEVRAIAQNGIANIIKVRHLRLVEEDAVFEFAGISHHHPVTHDHVFAHVTAAADPAVFADPCRSFQHRALFDNRAASDKNVTTDERFTDHFAEQGRFQTKLQIARDLFERVPDMLLVLKQLWMGRVFET